MLARTFNTSDRRLLGWSLVVIALASVGLFWLDYRILDERNTADAIGFVKVSTGDVRLKFSKDIEWHPGAQGDSLQYNDSIFSGKNSEAELHLTEGSVIVHQNSLISLRKAANKASFLSLRYGNVTGVLKAGEKLIVSTGEGAPTTIEATEATRVSFKRGKKRFELKVLSGKVELNSDDEQKKSVQQNEEMAWQVEEEPEMDASLLPAPVPEEEPASVAVMPEAKPNYRVRIDPASVRGQIEVSGKHEVMFKWQYDGPIDSQTKFVLELSRDQDFAGEIFSRSVLGQTETTLRGGGSDHFYYRVRGPQDEESDHQQFEVVYTAPPEPVKPEPVVKAKSRRRKTVRVEEEPQPARRETAAVDEPPPEPEFTPPPERTRSSKLKAELTPPVVFPETYNFWSWLGAGYNYVNYEQTYTDRGSIKGDGGNSNFGLFGEAGYLNTDGYGGALSWKSTPGEVNLTNAEITDSKYTWSTFSAEAMRMKWTTLWSQKLRWGGRLGTQYHSTPYLFLNFGDVVEMRYNRMLMLSLGPMAEMWAGRWRFHSSVRYQYPLYASGSDAATFSVSPKATFDGLLGTSYMITPRWRGGLFWYGQWLYFDAEFSDGTIENKGSQSLFYSVLDFRVGYEF